jgi:hypothetical protein
MSRFNTDILCMACIDEEKEAPGYKAAAESELEQVKQRNYNYPGVGLSPLDLGFVCGRMGRRGIGIDVITAYTNKHLPDDPAK